ncbi:hypothetical protein BH20ACT24_BH20ACT24_02940 [soil metagenome]
MWSWYSFWLILHVLTVVVAFGPTFAFPLIAAFGRKHPQFAVAALHISELIEKRLVLPMAVAVFVFGVALIVTGDFDIVKSEWLGISIVLYVIAFTFSVLVQTRNVNRMLRAIQAMPPGPPPEGAAPPPEIAALGRKLQLGGMYLTLTFLVILVLMIWKPGNCQGAAC